MTDKLGTVFLDDNIFSSKIVIFLFSNCDNFVSELRNTAILSHPRPILKIHDAVFQSAI